MVGEFEIQSKSFGEFISQVRQRRGLSQAAFAKRAKLSLALISKMERGETSNPSFDTVCQLADGLGVPPAELVKAHQDREDPAAAPPKAKKDVPQLEFPPPFECKCRPRSPDEGSSFLPAWDCKCHPLYMPELDTPKP